MYNNVCKVYTGFINKPNGPRNPEAPKNVFGDDSSRLARIGGVRLSGILVAEQVKAN